MTGISWTMFEQYAGADEEAAQAARPAPTLDEVRSHRDALLAAARRYGVRSVRVFGSVARGTAARGSDVDFLVDLPPSYSLLTLGGLYTEFEEALGRPVDVVVEGDLRGALREAALRDAVPL